MTYVDNNELLAKRWRKEHKYEGRGGVIVIYNGEVQSWVNELRDPQHWQPGCIAIDEQGNRYESVGGSDYDGSTNWLSIVVAD